MWLQESELALWTHLSLLSKDAPIPSVSILNFLAYTFSLKHMQNKWCTCRLDHLHPYARGQVWCANTLLDFCICWITTQLTLPFGALLGAAYSTALISAPSSLPPKDYQILIYSSEHLSSAVFLIHLAGHARPNSCNPGACGVCARFPALSHSQRRPPPTSFEMVAMNLHCIRWCGKQASPKWLLMIMPHGKECEHSMEMVRKAWRTGESRGCALEKCGQEKPGGDAVTL